MEHRLDVHEYLIEQSGTSHVYFQPPENVRLQYPAIVYFRSQHYKLHADNDFYHGEIGYDVTVIDLDPDSEIVAKFMKLPMCRWNRHFVADNLNHDVFTLYYK